MNTTSQPQLDHPRPMPAPPAPNDAAGRLLAALLTSAGVTRPAER
jgi:hypothetical protein